MNDAWIADRMRKIDASGIRKAFDMARSLKDPINLSIGLPDFDVADPVKEAAITAIREGRNAYTPTQGIAPLREILQERIDRTYGHDDRSVLITSGTSGGLLLALCCTVDPGDEVIFFDPYFVMYKHLTTLAGGTSVVIDTYPDFQVDLKKVRAAITDRTKCILVNSPANPTGVVATPEQLRELAALCQERGILLMSDEIYSAFTYDEPFASPASTNPDVLVVDGFSKTHGMTGWRVGFAHGPTALIQEMAKLQQFSFVCAPSPFQHAAIMAAEQDIDEHVEAYRRKRDLVVEALADDFELAQPTGAFYAFPKVPWGTGSEFAAEAIRRNLIIIPGQVFSQRDTHIRISYAASDETLKRGLDVLRQMAKDAPAAATIA